MFCVECGKDVNIFRNGVCLSCYLKSTQFSKGPTVIDLTMCSRCSSYKYKNTWIQGAFNDILKRFVKEAFTINPELSNVEIKIQCKEHDRILPCMVFISGCFENQAITEQHPLTIRIKHNTCDICSREAGGYYEAILQIRTEHRKFSKSEFSTIQSAVESMVGQFQISGKRRVFISDIDIKPEGLDFFLSDRGTALSIAKKIQERFGGDFKHSASSAGMKDSRQVYRMTYLVRIPWYRKGDFFSFDHSFFSVISFYENKVRVLELSTWTEKVVDKKDIQLSRIYGGKDLIKEMILVSQSKNEIQLMDPKTYTTVEIQKPKAISIDTQMVKTVRLGDTLFLVPEKLI